MKKCAVSLGRVTVAEYPERRRRSALPSEFLVHLLEQAKDRSELLTAPLQRLRLSLRPPIIEGRLTAKGNRLNFGRDTVSVSI